MDHATTILFQIFIVFIAAQIGAEISGRLKLPAVVGEIAAGVVIAPPVLGKLLAGLPPEPAPPPHDLPAAAET